MKKTAILAMKYYLQDRELDYTQIDEFCEDSKICDIDILQNKLSAINTRLVDRQSLALEAAINPFNSDKNYNFLDKSKISVIVGSLSASVYPIFEYLVSAYEKGVNFVNPTFFPNCVANAPASRLSIWNQFKNQVTSLSQGKGSGLDSIMIAKDEISSQKTEYAWAGASEETGAALAFVGDSDQKSIKPIAYIKNCESRYIGNLSEDQAKNFINSVISSWGVDKFKHSIIYSKDSKLFSLQPMLDLGRALLKIGNNELDLAVVVSVDSMGFVSMMELGRYI